ncbi:MAG: phosphatidate cytidylyltransferase [Gemmatimonadota bacterium]
MAFGDLSRRVAVAGVGIPVGVLVLVVGGWAFVGLVAILAALGCREFYILAAGSGARPFTLLGMLGSLAVVLVVALSPDLGRAAAGTWLVVLTLFFLTLSLAVWRRWPDGNPAYSVSATVAGVIYVAGGFSFAILLRGLPPASAGLNWAGALILIFPLVVTWMGDSAAYFAGSRWGRKKLLPTVSPGKTVVGGVAGLVASMISGGLFAALALAHFSEVSISPIHAVLLAIPVALVAQVGDLAESLLKREAGAKDSGALLPGHGGVLDRFDAILLTLPLTYALLQIPGVLP